MNLYNKTIFAIYKLKGPTSFDVVAQVRKITGVKKVGHAGTLDPLASGVLVIAVGREATKQLSEIVGQEKEYIADIRLGLTSTTDDEEGSKQEIKKLKKSEIKEEDIKGVLKKFVGEIDQMPPKYSAIKVNGRRAYKSARKGEVVELKPRKVEIKEIEILDYKYPDLKLRVITGKGVYIRSLARDLGVVLGVGGYLADLERIRVGEFRIEDCVERNILSKCHCEEAEGRRGNPVAIQRDPHGRSAPLHSLGMTSVVNILKSGGIGILPTDTVYGLVGLALNQNVVERIYQVKTRQPDKPFIILVSSIDDLKLFGISPVDNLKDFWPGPVSIILPCDNEKFAYLHRGTNSLAFRLPDKSELIDILAQTGPLVAPSANPEGQESAKTASEAKEYFGDLVDFYVDAGEITAEPSTLIKVDNGSVTVLRQGAIKLK